MNNCNTDRHSGPVRCRPFAPQQGALFLRLLLVLLLLCPATSSLAAPILTVEQPPEKIDLTPYIDIIDNPDHQLGIDDLIAPKQLNQFAPVILSSRNALSSFSPSFWLRFSISNTSQAPLIFWLKANHNAIGSMEVYHLGSNHDPERIDDAIVRNNELSPILKEIVIPPRSSATYLIDLQTTSRQSLKLTLVRPDVFMPEEISRAVVFSFALGILALATLINLLIALYRQSMLFLFNSCFILANTAIHAISLGIPHSLFSNFSESQHTAIATLFYLGTTASLLLVQEYLKITNSQNRYYQKLKSAAYANAVLGLPVIFLADHWPILVLTPLAIALPFIIAAFMDCYNRYGDRIALSVCITTVGCAIPFALLILFQAPGFSLDMLNDNWIIYLFVLHSLIITTLFIIREYIALKNELDHKLVIETYHARHKAQNDLLQEFSGDMQTPLSGILGMADLLKSSSLTAEQHGRVDAIKNSGQTLLNKIADIHYRVQLEQNSENIRKLPFELGLLLENCINSFRHTAETRTIELILQIQPDIPAVVKGDEYRLRQIIIQLLDNAIKNTEQGQILLKVSRNATDNDIIYFNIQDTGRGIAEDKIINLTKTSRDKDPGQKHSGLPSVTKLLAQLKSELLIDSIEGEGSTFSFLLDLPAVENRHDKNKSLDEILHHKQLLIVDDNQTTCKVLKQLANSWGMQAAEAHSGIEALAMYRAKENLGETFDAIILDYDMPQVSGIDVAEKITLEARENQPVIIMLAGLSQSPPEHIAKQAGVDMILSKPASQKLLKLTLCNLFQMRQKSTLLARAKPGKKLRILVADDNDVIRSVISKMMESMDVEYRMVTDGKMAVDAAQKEAFDIILMDCEMPFMNGFEATQRIHAWQRERHQPLTPVIALTAYTLGEHKQQSIAAGMADFLEKPINMAELEAVLQRYHTGHYP